MKQALLSLTLLLLPMFMMIQGVHAHSHGNDHGHGHHHHNEDKDMKKGILLAAFGSSYPQAQPALDNIERMTREAFPEVPVRWAYTSRIVRHSLAAQGEHFDSVAMALARMEDEGFTHVAVQSLHTIPGKEFHELRSVVSAFQNMESNLQHLSLGAPLLNEPDELVKVREVMLEIIPGERQPDEAVIWVGHGSYHPANAFYVALAHLLQAKDENVHLATMGHLGEEVPSFDRVKEQIKAKGVSRVYLMPFMSVVGAHTIRDVAGKDNSDDHDHNHDHAHNHSNDHDHHHGDSWKERLQNAGIETEVVLKGTGEYEDVVNIWLDQLKKAADQLH